MKFEAAREMYGDQAPPSLAGLLDDAETAGAVVTTVYVVTELGPARGAKGVTFTRGPLGQQGVTVVVPCPLAARGTHVWGHGFTVSRCAVTHSGPPCAGPGCSWATAR